jgi:hypothetical protein
VGIEAAFIKDKRFIDIHVDPGICIPKISVDKERV